jgi:hypothetical protein
VEINVLELRRHLAWALRNRPCAFAPFVTGERNETPIYRIDRARRVVTGGTRDFGMRSIAVVAQYVRGDAAAFDGTIDDGSGNNATLRYSQLELLRHVGYGFDGQQGRQRDG